MRLSRILLASASVLAICGVANAADLIVDESAPVDVVSAAHDWSGVYVGASVGFGTGTVDWTGDFFDDITDAPGGSLDGSFDVSGWTAGVQAGANVQFDMFVLGVEGDINWANITGEGENIGPGPDFTVPSATIDWIGSLRGRAGVAIDQVLLYGTAGFAFAGGEFGITNLDFAGDDQTGDINATGWTAGFGAEVALDENLSIKGEYLFTHLTPDEVIFDMPADPEYLATNADIGIHTFKVGLNYSF
ncbi:MAG: porin family protein [Devosia sp.]|uniref:outer membrane protein n=1 Tax=Devosia sp. TaxID=1871048 RepID=UPI0026287CC0|nr:outer membrane protein [Devosia sp.]MDB5542805.1 porin family protein [Devosia sp.]